MRDTPAIEEENIPAFMAGLVLNKTADIKEYGRDRYGRVLDVVSFGGNFINLEMVQAGFAEVYRGDPAPSQELAYLKPEAKAKAAKRGRLV